MKKVIIILFCFFSMASLINSGCKNKTTANKEVNFKVDSLSVNGKANIEQILAKENGVIFVKAHLRKQVVTIVYDTIIASKNKFAGVLENMGYKVESTVSVKIHQ